MEKIIDWGWVTISISSGAGLSDMIIIILMIVLMAIPTVMFIQLGWIIIRDTIDDLTRHPIP